MRNPADRRVLAGRYRLDEVIAQGGMATIYRARDLQLERDVAVKLLRGALAEAHRFRSEARLLASLEHRNLVRLYDAGDTDGVPFLVLGLVEGATLAETLRDGPLPAGDVVRVGAEVAAALAHVHAAGVVHRDVKPSNILLDGAGTAMLADFGIARLLDSTSATQTGLVVGTARYLSPEQAAGEPVGPATDVYALGLVLLEAFTGRPAFEGSGAELAAARLVRSPHVPEKVPPGPRVLLGRMLARQPEQRPTAAEVTAELAAGASSAASATVVRRHEPTVLLPAGARRLPAWLWVVPALVVAFLVTAFVGWGGSAGSGDGPDRTTSTVAPAAAVPHVPTTVATTPTTATPPTSSPCASFEDEKRALEAAKQQVEQQLKDDEDAREAEKDRIEEQKKAVEARKQQAGC